MKKELSIAALVFSGAMAYLGSGVALAQSVDVSAEKHVKRVLDLG